MSLSVAGRVRRALESHTLPLIKLSAYRDSLPTRSLFMSIRRRTAHVRVQVMNAIVKCGLEISLTILRLAREEELRRGIQRRC